MSELQRPPTAPSSAFDAVAAEYDRRFTHRRLGRWMRQSVHDHLRVYAPGERILELGCGTGEDAVWLAQRQVQVVSTDVSQAMLEVARGKIRRAGVVDRVQLTRLDLNAAGSLTLRSLFGPFVDSDTDSPSCFDGCFASFGVLNCVDDRPALASRLAELVRPGARVILVAMGPLCPWEITAFVAHGRLASAGRRLRSGARAQIGDQSVRVWYPSPRRLRREFAPWFRPLRRRGVGVLLPHSELVDLVDRWPAVFERLRRWETALGDWFPAPWLCDHYLLELERRG